MSLLATVLTETEELAPLIMSPFAFAGIAVAVFAAIGLVTWSFRDVANRHSQKTGTASSSHGTDSHTAGH